MSFILAQKMDNRIDAGCEIGVARQIGVFCQIDRQLSLIYSYPPILDGMNQLAIHPLFITIGKHELNIDNRLNFKSFY